MPCWSGPIWWLGKGVIEPPLAPVAALTVHPSAILRMRDPEQRDNALAGLADDLRLLASAASKR